MATKSSIWIGADGRVTRGRRAVSLVEVGIAAALIACAVVPMVVSMVSSRTGLVASMEEVSATAEAVRTMQALERLPFEEVPVANDGESVPDTAWNDQRFSWPAESDPVSRPGRSPSLSLASLGPPLTAPGMHRFLSIGIVPAGPGIPGRRLFLKMAEVRITWQRPGSRDAEAESVLLCTLLRPALRP